MLLYSLDSQSKALLTSISCNCCLRLTNKFLHDWLTRCHDTDVDKTGHLFLCITFQKQFKRTEQTALHFVSTTRLKMIKAVSIMTQCVCVCVCVCLWRLTVWMYHWVFWGHHAQFGSNDSISVWARIFSWRPAHSKDVTEFIKGIIWCKRKICWGLRWKKLVYKWKAKNATKDTSCSTNTGRMRMIHTHTHTHTHTHYSPSLFRVSQRGSHCEAFSFRTDKALPVRSLLAATSHAAQGGSPASYSVFPSHQPFRLSTVETTPGLWMAIAAGEATHKQPVKPISTHTHTHKHLCICGCTHRFKTHTFRSEVTHSPTLTSAEYQWQIQVEVLQT